MSWHGSSWQIGMQRSCDGQKDKVQVDVQLEQETYVDAVHIFNWQRVYMNILSFYSEFHRHIYLNRGVRFLFYHFTELIKFKELSLGTACRPLRNTSEMAGN